jgi:hypothetical protein
MMDGRSTKKEVGRKEELRNCNILEVSRTYLEAKELIINPKHFTLTSNCSNDIY